MTSFIGTIDIDNVNVTMDTAVIPLGKGQDRAIVGSVMNETGNTIYHATIFDGHGTNDAIFAIDKLIDMDKLVVQSTNPCIAAFEILNNDSTIPIYSGSTMSSIKITGNVIECSNMGDSETVVFINGRIVHRNKIHNIMNEKEKLRLKDKGFEVKSHRPVVLNSRVINFESSKALQFYKQENTDYELVIVPTQSIGHKGITGIDPDIFSITFDPLADRVVCLAMSDGVLDVICDDDLPSLESLTSCEIAEFAKQRWRQIWMDKNGIAMQFPEDGCDDIGVARICYDVNAIV